MITSLHSPHVERVKALLGSKGKKVRKAEGIFISDGYQAMKSALRPGYSEAPQIEKIYATTLGIEKLQSEFLSTELSQWEIVAVSDEVMAAMSDAQTSQGVLALCRVSQFSFQKLRARTLEGGITRIAYFWQMQDPGNAGTVIRSADAFGCDAVLFSPDSVDIYSPKTIRATVGSLWNLPVVEDVELDEITKLAVASDIPLLVFDGGGESSLLELESERFISLFGNEARGVPDLTAIDLQPDIRYISIPMLGKTESLNVASAATVALFHLAKGRLGAS